MKIKINKHEFNINAVWDRDDKFLVIIDDKNKFKYIINTWNTLFSASDIDSLISIYADKILNLREFDIMKSGKIRTICHNDDFFNNYKRKYKLISYQQSGLWY